MTGTTEIAPGSGGRPPEQHSLNSTQEAGR